MSSGPNGFLKEVADNLENVLVLLHESSKVLGNLYEADANDKQGLRKAELDLKNALDGHVLDLEFLAQSTKEGPLAGLAKTSSAYKMAVDVVRETAKRKEFPDLAVEVEHFSNKVLQTEIEFFKEKQRFTALRLTVDGVASLLRALS